MFSYPLLPLTQKRFDFRMSVSDGMEEKGRGIGKVTKVFIMFMGSKLSVRVELNQGR